MEKIGPIFYWSFLFVTLQFFSWEIDLIYKKANKINLLLYHGLQQASSGHVSRLILLVHLFDFLTNIEYNFLGPLTEKVTLPLDILSRDDSGDIDEQRAKDKTKEPIS